MDASSDFKNDVYGVSLKNSFGSLQNFRSKWWLATVMSDWAATGLNCDGYWRARTVVEEEQQFFRC